jgi:hypothetical protein
MDDSTFNTPPDALPVIELLVSKKPHPPDSPAREIGIVAAGEPRALTTAAIGLDVIFPPIGGCGSTAVTFNGGAIGTADPVQLLFWGPIWQTLPDPSNPSQLLANTFVAAVQSILSGPYMSGLLQYGVRRCSFGNAQIINSNPPFLPNKFTDPTVQNLMQNLIDNGNFPEPDEPGGRNLYFVMMPPNTQYQPPPNSPNARGAHSFFSSGSSIDPDYVWVAWVGTNSLSQMTSTFCHELAEMCTDPEGPSGWFINGAPAGCNEIGDVCNLEDSLLNGVTVESYWSIFDKACLIPTAWSVRRTLAAVNKKLAGKGLRSLQNPIPSMNVFIVNV